MPEKTQTYEHVKRPKVSRVDRFKRMQKNEGAQIDVLQNLLNRKNQKQREKEKSTSAFKDVVDNVLNKFNTSLDKFKEASRDSYKKNMSPDYSPKDAIKDAGMDVVHDFAKSFREVGELGKVIGGAAMSKTVNALKKNKEKFAGAVPLSGKDKQSFVEKLNAAKEKGRDFMSKFRGKIRDTKDHPKRALDKAKAVSQRAINKGREFAKDPLGNMYKGYRNIEAKAYKKVQDQIDKGKKGLGNPEAQGFGKTMANAFRYFAGGKAAKVMDKERANFTVKYKHHENKRIELGKVNDQGLMCVKDDKIKGGFRFEAVRDTGFPTGELDKHGKPVYMHLEKGQTTGVIVPKGRKQMESFAQMTHGDRDINLGISHDSVVTFDKNSSAMPDKVLSGAGKIVNSEVNFKKGSRLIGKPDIENSTVNVNDVTVDPEIYSSGVKSLGKANNVKLKNMSMFDNHGSVKSSTFQKGSFVNTNHSQVENSNFFDTAADYSGQGESSIVKNSHIKHAQVRDTDFERSDVNNGSFSNSAIRHSNLNLTNNSHIETAMVDNSQVTREHENAGRLLVNHAHLDHDTVGLSMYNDQKVTASVVRNAFMSGRNNIENSIMHSDTTHPSLVRNFSGKNLNVQLHDKGAAFTEAEIPNGHNHQIGDSNLPKDRELNDQNMQAIKDGLGVEHTIDDTQTDEGKISAIDRIKLISRSARKPGQMIKAKLREFFNLRPQPEHEHVKSKHDEEEHTHKQDEPDAADDMF